MCILCNIIKTYQDVSKTHIKSAVIIHFFSNKLTINVVFYIFSQTALPWAAISWRWERVKRRQETVKRLKRRRFLLWELWTTNTIWLWCIWFLSTTLQCNALMIYIQILILNAGPKTVNCTVSVGRGCHNQTMIWCYRRQWCYNDVTDDRDLKTWTWLFDQCPLVGRPSFHQVLLTSLKSKIVKKVISVILYSPSQYLVLVLNSLTLSRIQRQLGFKIIQWKHHWLLWSTFCVVSSTSE